MRVRPLDDTPWLIPAIAVAVGALLRIPGLETNPNGFYCDEASAGYDAWSLLRTARDQYGTFLPAFARSFGDWDEASYRYLVVPFVALLGPTVTAVRLPAALAGLATIPALHALVRRTHGARAADLAALVLAISPWHVLLSRVGFRAVLAPLAVIVMLLLIAQARERPARWIGAGIAGALALWTYSPARIVVPVLALIAVSLQLPRVHRRVLAPLALGSAIFVGALELLATFWTSPEGMARARAELRNPFELAAFVEAYVGYFDAPFLAVEGDPNWRHSLPGWAQLHAFELLTIPVGLLAVLARHRKDDAMLLLWLAVAPIPAALTTEHHALRAILALPPLTILSGIGLAAIAERMRTERARTAANVATGATLLVAAMLLVRAVQVDYPRDVTAAWQWGMRETVLALRRADRGCRVLSDRFFLPHVFVAFFARIPPEEYQQRPVRTVSQRSRDLGGWELAGWRVRPIGEALGDPRVRGCAFASFGADAERVADEEATYHQLDAFYDPNGGERIVVFQLGAPAAAPSANETALTTPRASGSGRSRRAGDDSGAPRTRRLTARSR